MSINMHRDISTRTSLSHHHNKCALHIPMPMLCSAMPSPIWYQWESVNVPHTTKSIAKHWNTTRDHNTFKKQQQEEKQREKKKKSDTHNTHNVFVVGMQSKNKLSKRAKCEAHRAASIFNILTYNRAIIYRNTYIPILNSSTVLFLAHWTHCKYQIIILKSKIQVVPIEIR